MTNTHTTHYVVCLLLAFMTIGVSTVVASEVTGTLSSDATVKESPSGNLSGTVSNDANEGNLSGTVTSGANEGSLSGTVTDEGSNGTLTGTVESTSPQSGGRSSGSSSGFRSGSGGEDTTSPPAGAVLGATTDNSTAPLFPNTGVAPATPVWTLWSALLTFLGNLVS